MKNFVMLIAAIMISSPIAFGADKDDKAAKIDKSSWMNMSAETRKQMADMHQKMADCMKSNKPISECRTNMMANCPMMKDGSCPMMGMMMHDYDDDNYRDCMHH